MEGIRDYKDILRFFPTTREEALSQIDIITEISENHKSPGKRTIKSYFSKLKSEGLICKRDVEPADHKRGYHGSHRLFYRIDLPYLPKSTEIIEWVERTFRKFEDEDDLMLKRYYLNTIRKYIEINSVPAYEMKELIDRCEELFLAENIKIRMASYYLFIQVFKMPGLKNERSWLEGNENLFLEKIRYVFESFSSLKNRDLELEIGDETRELFHQVFTELYKSDKIPDKMLDFVIEKFVRTDIGFDVYWDLLKTDILNLENRRYVKDMLKKKVNYHYATDVHERIIDILESELYDKLLEKSTGESHQ